MSSEKDSYEKTVVENSLKTFGVVLLTFGLALFLDFGSDWLVDHHILKQESVIYYCLQFIAKLIEICESVVIAFIVLRHAYDSILRVLKV